MGVKEGGSLIEAQHGAWVRKNLPSFCTAFPRPSRSINFDGVSKRSARSTNTFRRGPRELDPRPRLK